MAPRAGIEPVDSDRLYLCMLDHISIELGINLRKKE